MKRLLLIILVIFIGGMLMACAAPTAPAESAIAAFEPIIIFGTGGGEMTSPPFTVTTAEWIIDWSYILVPEPRILQDTFSFFIYSKGKIANQDMYIVAMLFAKEKGTTYCYAGAGEYYLVAIAGHDLENWKVIISPP